MPKFETEEQRAAWRQKCADTRARNKLAKGLKHPALANGFADPSTSKIPMSLRHKPVATVIDLSPVLEAIDSKIAELQQQRKVVVHTIAMVSA